jgi:uncharacterized protein involved in exopolysaccharide biosynthesis
MENNIYRQILDPTKKIKIADRKAPLYDNIKTEKLDLERPDLVRRLLGKNMISADEKMAPAAVQKSVEAIGKLKKSNKNDRLKLDKNTEVKKNKALARAAKLRASDWAALMTYDIATGNLFKFDPKTGQLDSRSNAIFRSKGMIKRLLDHDLILPGGWLTPKAKRQCEKLQKQIKKHRPSPTAKPLKKKNCNNASLPKPSSEVFKITEPAPSLKYGKDPTDHRMPQAPETYAFSLRDILNVVFKRKAQILLVFVTVVSAVTFGTLLAIPAYEAAAQLLVKMGRESIFIPATGNMNPVINNDREERINSEIEILKSRALAEKVVAALGPTVIYENLKDDNRGILDRLIPDADAHISPDEIAALKFEKAVANLNEALQVEAIKDSNVIQINFKHENPYMTATVVNNLADIYLDHHLEIHKTHKSVKFFQHQSQLLKSKLEESEKELKVLKKLHNITSLEEERGLLLKQTADLRTELNKTMSQVVETEKRIQQLRQQLGKVPITIAQGEETDQNSVLISTLEARLVELELKEKELSAKYTKQSRRVLNVKDEIRVVREKLNKQEKKHFGRKRTGLNPNYQHLQATLYENEAELSALKAKAETQEGQLAEYQQKLAKLNKIEMQLNQLQQQVDVDRQSYRLYLSKFEESRISDAMDTEKIASVSLIQPASPPREPVSPKKLLNFLLAIFLGAFGGLGLAFFVEYLDDKLEKVEDVEEVFQLPVLASIPEMTIDYYIVE